MSNDAFINDLAAELRPISRRSIARETLLLLAIAGSEIALILVAGLVRPDMSRAIGSAFMTWKIGSLVLLATMTMFAALRSFTPGVTTRNAMLAAAGLALAAIAVAPFVTPGGDAGLTLGERLAPAHGMVCATAIVVLALPLLMALGIVMRRAAPTRPTASACVSGIAAGISGALVFTLCCPMNDPLYIVVWYAIGCAAVATLGRWLLPRRFRL